MALSAADAMTLQTGVWRADTEVTAGIHTTHHSYYTKQTRSTHNTITALQPYTCSTAGNALNDKCRTTQHTAGGDTSTHD